MKIKSTWTIIRDMLWWGRIAIFFFFRILNSYWIPERPHASLGSYMLKDIKSITVDDIVGMHLVKLISVWSWAELKYTVMVVHDLIFYQACHWSSYSFFIPLIVHHDNEKHIVLICSMHSSKYFSVFAIAINYWVYGLV